MCHRRSRGRLFRGITERVHAINAADARWLEFAHGSYATLVAINAHCRRAAVGFVEVPRSSIQRQVSSLFESLAHERDYCPTPSPSVGSTMHEIRCTGS